MCIIVYIPEGEEVPKEEILRNCWERNSHGAGMMYPKDGEVVIRKGFMKWEQFKAAYDKAVKEADGAAIALHFRIATHGAIKPGCTHPFAVCKDYRKMRATNTRAAVGFMHNGVLNGFETSKDVSDSMAFARNVIAPLRAMCAEFIHDKCAMRIIGSSTQGSRFLIMDGTGDVRTFGRWHEHEGIFYSNESFLARSKPVYWEQVGTCSQGALFDAFTAFSDTDIEESDLTAFGLYGACANCQVLEECIEYLPYCSDEEQAEEMAQAYPSQ